MRPPIHKLQPDPILNAELKAVIEENNVRLGTKPGMGVYSPSDWARLDYVLTQCLTFASAHGGREAELSVLDVGIGGGQLVNALALSKAFRVVAGVDVRWHSTLKTMSDHIELHQSSIKSLPFAANAFDLVICMEVLEHVSADVFTPGLQELRRVAKDRLIMTVPFEEPEPIPSFHLRRFVERDLEELFPVADTLVLESPVAKHVNWALITEYCP